jgi:hypothetical protein
MKRVILLAIFLLSLATQANAVDGTLAITMTAAPVGGLSTPRIMVIHGYERVIHNTLAWGGIWSQSLPSGKYRVMPMPVHGGASFYVADSMIVTVPPGGIASPSISYHAI